MLRQLLALTFLLAATASRLRKRDENAYDSSHARHSRSTLQQEKFFPRVDDYGACIPGKSNCDTDNYQCQDIIGNGSYQCAPVAIGGSACLAPPLLANCDTSGYDKNVPPAMALYGGQTVVKIDMYLRNMFQYQDSGLYNLDLFVNIIWKDPRLAHQVQPILLYHTKGKLESIWRPDIFFSTAAQTYRQDLLAPSVSLRIYQDGWVEWSERVQVVTPCRYDACVVTIETYDHIRNLLDVFWHGTPSDPAITVDRSLANKVPAVETTYCPQEYYDGEYACLIAIFKLIKGKKQTGPHFVIQTMTNTPPETSSQAHTTGQPQSSGQPQGSGQSLPDYPLPSSSQALAS